MVFIVDRHFEIVIVLASVYLEAWLVDLKRDAIADTSTKHQLRALHEVVHYVLKLRHEGLFVDEIKVDALSSSYLNSDVAFDEEDLTTEVVKCEVVVPQACFLIDFEEEDAVGASDDEGLIVDQIHISQVVLGDLFLRYVVWLSSCGSDELALPVKGMAGKRDCAIEGLDGEVSRRTVGNYRLRDLTHWRFLNEIICKVILSLFKSMIS